MRTKPTIVLILFLLWGAGSTYWYVCKIKGFCENNVAATETAVEPSATEESGNAGTETGVSEPEKPVAEASESHDLLYYKTGDTQVYVSNDSLWQLALNQLLAGEHKGKRLEITGPYYAFEKNGNQEADPGLARARSVKELLARWTDTTGMLLRSKELEAGTEKPAYLDGYKDYVKWVNYNDYVKTEQDVTRVYFPFNSAKEIRNPEIVRYLDEVARSLKEHPEWKVEITGHTDNIGSAETNRWKGMERAKRIRAILLKKGVSAGQIITRSEGEDKPIADNATAEGRKQNRRVEIRFIK